MSEPVDADDAHRALILSRETRDPRLHPLAQYYDTTRVFLAILDQFPASETTLDETATADLAEMGRAARRLRDQIRETAADERPDAVRQSLENYHSDGGGAW